MSFPTTFSLQYKKKKDIGIERATTLKKNLRKNFCYSQLVFYLYQQLLAARHGGKKRQQFNSTNHRIPYHFSCKLLNTNYLVSSQSQNNIRQKKTRANIKKKSGSRALVRERERERSVKEGRRAGVAAA